MFVFVLVVILFEFWADVLFLLFLSIISAALKRGTFCPGLDVCIVKRMRNMIALTVSRLYALNGFVVVVCTFFCCCFY